MKITFANPEDLRRFEILMRLGWAICVKRVRRNMGVWGLTVNGRAWAEFIRKFLLTT